MADFEDVMHITDAIFTGAILLDVLNLPLDIQDNKQLKGAIMRKHQVDIYKLERKGIIIYEYIPAFIHDNAINHGYDVKNRLGSFSQNMSAMVMIFLVGTNLNK